MLLVRTGNFTSTERTIHGTVDSILGNLKSFTALWAKRSKWAGYLMVARLWQNGHESLPIERLRILTALWMTRRVGIAFKDTADFNHGARHRWAGAIVVSRHAGRVGWIGCMA